MEKPKTGLDDCLIILLSCFGKMMSVGGGVHKTYTHIIHGYGHTWVTRGGQATVKSGEGMATKHP